MMESFRPPIYRKLLAVLICLLIQPFYLVIPASASDGLLTPDAAQAADIIGVRQEAEQIVALRGRGGLSESERGQLNTYRALVLRKILVAVLQVQAAENRLESEMAYTYDVLARENRKIDTVNQFFNIANFTQLCILYGIVEPYSRIHRQFIQSAVGTCVGSGLAIGLPVLNIMYNKFARASHLTPPGFLSHMIDGRPVDGSHLPPLVARYMDSAAPGTSSTRRQELNALWKKRYRADMDKKETLAGIDDGKSKKTAVLNTRIVLLWSLFTTIQSFDKDLHALLNQCTGYQTAGEYPAKARIGTATGLSSAADEAARLLKIESLVAELKSLSGSADSLRQTELQIALLEAVLSGFLDMQIAIDRCQEELNYQYDVVLAQMMARRGKFLQKTYEANFIQTGTIGACAGWCYLNHYGKAGNQLFMVENSIGLGITTVSLLATHGGWRKNQTQPNSLADFFDLRSKGIHGFSPLVWNFLNCPSTRSANQSRREYLMSVWTKRSITNMDLKKQKNLEKLGSMPSCKWDTIKLVINRIALLTSLQEQLSEFDAELLDLLRQAWPSSIVASASGGSPSLTPPAAAAANLLGLQGLVVSSGQGDQTSKLLITRNILEGFLDATTDANRLATEIIIENHVVTKMTRERDMAIQLTNIANFYQIGILGIISDALGVSNDKTYVLYGDRLNMVSGGLIGGLAAGALLERQGGIRMSKTAPNHLSYAFGKTSNFVKLSPTMVRYLNSPSPISSTNLSRREELVKYWKESKVLNVNVKRESNIEKLSAEGRAHHWWNETIKLINNRITMLYDLRAVMRSSNIGFYELLSAID